MKLGQCLRQCLNFTQKSKSRTFHQNQSGSSLQNLGKQDLYHLTQLLMELKKLSQSECGKITDLS